MRVCKITQVYQVQRLAVWQFKARNLYYAELVEIVEAVRGAEDGYK